MLNTVHNGYRITELISSMSMGSLYRAESPGDPTKKVLIHLIEKKYFLSPSVSSQYQDWSGMLRQLRHDSLLPCLDYWSVSDYHGVVYEDFEGDSLQDVINDRSLVWDRDQIDNLVGDVLSALHYVSAKGHAHLQVNPTTVLYNSTTGEVKVHSFFFNTTAWTNYVSALPIELLTDEVLGVMAQGSGSLDEAQLDLMNYMSPEQVEGLPLNSQSDIYATGILLFRLVTQTLPYANFHSEAEYADRIQTLTVNDRIAEFQGLPEHLTAAIVQATATEADQRFSNARDFEGKIRQLRAAEHSEMTSRVIGQDAVEAVPDDRTAYSDLELEDFRRLIDRKLLDARKELSYLQDMIAREDGVAVEGDEFAEREQLAQMASRQITFIDLLEKALERIENKTYGICRVTGKLIEKERLLAVPTATISQRAKDHMNTPPTGNSQDSDLSTTDPAPAVYQPEQTPSGKGKFAIWLAAIAMAGVILWMVYFRGDAWSKAPVYQTIVGELSLRVDTGVNSSINQMLLYGEEVRMINIPEIYPWVRVKTKYGVEGFVYGPMLADQNEYNVLNKLFTNSRMMRHIDQYYRRRSLIEYFRNSDMWDSDSTLKWKLISFYRNGDDRYAFQKRRYGYSYFRVRLKHTSFGQEKDVVFIHKLQSGDVWEELQHAEYNPQDTYSEYYIENYLRQYNLD